MRTFLTGLNAASPRAGPAAPAVPGVRPGGRSGRGRFRSPPAMRGARPSFAGLSPTSRRPDSAASGRRSRARQGRSSQPGHGAHSVCRHITTRNQSDPDRHDGRPPLLRDRVGGSSWPREWASACPLRAQCVSDHRLDRVPSGVWFVLITTPAQGLAALPNWLREFDSRHPLHRRSRRSRASPDLRLRRSPTGVHAPVPITCRTSAGSQAHSGS